MMPPLTIDGWDWPANDRDAHPIITRDCKPSIERLLPHIEGRDLIVQAGANVGLYPVALAQHFEAVFTCEPDPVNYACLAANLLRHDPEHKVTALHAAFGAEQGGCQPIEVTAGNCGAHRVSFTEKGLVPVWTIDGLELDACDAIWLDCEGSEFYALLGSAGTIARFSPVIAFEEKGLGREFFDLPAGAAEDWLALHRYAQVDKIGNDKVFKR